MAKLLADHDVIYKPKFMLLYFNLVISRLEKNLPLKNRNNTLLSKSILLIQLQGIIKKGS